MAADLLAEEAAPPLGRGAVEFLLRTRSLTFWTPSFATPCRAQRQRDALRRMEADLKFVGDWTGPRGTWRYHPLLAEMLRSESQKRTIRKKCRR